MLNSVNANYIFRNPEFQKVKDYRVLKLCSQASICMLQQHFKKYPQAMILHVNHKTLSAPLEVDFKVPLPTLNIQLMLNFILAVAFKNKLHFTFWA